MALWYFETATTSGRWAPNTSPEPPPTRKQAGILRTGIGHTGPRVRGIVPVPDHLHGATLDRLQAELGASDA